MKRRRRRGSNPISANHHPSTTNNNTIPNTATTTTTTTTSTASTTNHRTMRWTMAIFFWVLLTLSTARSFHPPYQGKTLHNTSLINNINNINSINSINNNDECYKKVQPCSTSTMSRAKHSKSSKHHFLYVSSTSADSSPSSSSSSSSAAAPPPHRRVRNWAAQRLDREPSRPSSSSSHNDKNENDSISNSNNSSKDNNKRRKRRRHRSSWRVIETASSNTNNSNANSNAAEEAAASYQRRKQEWAKRYTHVDSLRQTFGANRNKLWGDLDAATARRLYKTLLPTALLELAKVGVQNIEDLAPLSYQARVAAKLYARERCQVPARVAATLYDGMRQFQKYGKFQGAGMSYQQIWEKYHQAILLEAKAEDDAEQQKDKDNDNNIDKNGLVRVANANANDEDVTAKICLRILERSCTTNEQVDRWVLPSDRDEGLQEDLLGITQTLERDVRKLLDPLKSKQVPSNHLTKQHYRIFRLLTRARRRAKLRRAIQNSHNNHDNQHQHTSTTATATATSTTATTTATTKRRQQRPKNTTTTTTTTGTLTVPPPQGQEDDAEP